MKRTVALGAAGALSLTVSLAPAAAADAIVQTVACVQVSTGQPIHTISEAQHRMAFTEVWPITSGAGVKVAVIDTGVSEHPLLAGRVISGPDLVVPGQRSTVDCDGHGTLVAGLIAASPDPSSGFSGVAPEASIVSIRQASSRYELQADDRSHRPVGDASTLATAINDAIAAGVGVINISQTGCVPAGISNTSDDDLAAAITAAAAADIVVVAAAGNLGESCAAQNEPGTSPVTIPLPARFTSVLAVAALDGDGAAAGFSLAGPWVDIAAPGTDIVSLDPGRGATGLVNQLATGSSLIPIDGTSFAAPYVSGVVALVRAAHPELTAGQVVDRIIATAQHPPSTTDRNDYLGYGTVNAMAAVSAILPIERIGAAASQRAIPAAVRPVAVDTFRHQLALRLAGLAITVLVLGAAGIVSVRRACRLGRGTDRPSRVGGRLR